MSENLHPDSSELKVISSNVLSCREHKDIKTCSVIRQTETNMVTSEAFFISYSDANFSLVYMKCT